jgi:hypothetical protein
MKQPEIYYEGEGHRLNLLLPHSFLQFYLIIDILIQDDINYAPASFLKLKNLFNFLNLWNLLNVLNLLNIFHLLHISHFLPALIDHDPFTA